MRKEFAKRRQRCAIEPRDVILALTFTNILTRSRDIANTGMDCEIDLDMLIKSERYFATAIRTDFMALYCVEMIMCVDTTAAGTTHFPVKNHQADFCRVDPLFQYFSAMQLPFLGKFEGIYSTELIIGGLVDEIAPALDRAAVRDIVLK